MESGRTRYSSGPKALLMRCRAMFVFLDFEASSLSKRSRPIEVAWVFEDGRSEAHLIRSAPGWDDWDAQAQAIHHIDRGTLETDGSPHEVVAKRMVEVLAGHDLFASAPSWDGKWLSALLRAAGLPRHSLRLRDTEEAQRETAAAILADWIGPDDLARAVEDLVVLTDFRERSGPPAHRALADALDEHRRWIAVREAALRQRAEASLNHPPAAARPAQSAGREAAAGSAASSSRLPES